MLAYYQTGTLFALDAQTGKPMGIVLALENGIPLRDLVWMDQDLSPPSSTPGGAGWPPR